MIAVNLDNVSVTYISDPIFKNLSWEIHDDRVVGLVGPNGSGKSTLLRLIFGELTSDSGYTVRQKGLIIGYLEQEPVLNLEHSVIQEALTASTEIAKLESELAFAEVKLADPNVYENEKTLQRTLDQQARLLKEYTDLGGPGYAGHVRSTLINLGFSEIDFDLPVKALSGGQIKLIGLAKLLIVQPDLLLLDEPDNHLDLQGKAFLESYIRSYKGAVIIVSHDRYLLDLVAEEIVEIEDGRLTRFIGNYSEYAYEKQINLARQHQQYHTQQQEIKRLEQAAKRLLMWGKIYDNEKFSKRGRNIQNRIGKIERIEKPTLERKRMGLELKGWRGSNKVLEIIDLSKEFPREIQERPGLAEKKAATSPNQEKTSIILLGLNLLIWQGERVGLVGPNGAGKSLLYRLILDQEIPSSGAIKLGPSVKVGFYAQEHETLEYDRTLIETVRLAAPLSENAAVAFLGRFLFNYEQARGKVSDLSGGERSRLQMGLLMLSGANFLLLDEPTNNLDITSAEVLESSLEKFEGTVLVISHDRYFLDRVVDRIVELDQGSLTEFIGNYSDYQAAKSRQELKV
jgi:ATP-binding cassette subfamily F protein 3